MIAHRDRLGVLLLGCGFASAMHSRVLRRMKGIDLAYASRDLARAEEQRRRFHGRLAYDSYDDALADSSLDVAVVTTPTFMHRDLTIRALRAGKHVIVEKPAFMTSADADLVRLEAVAAHRQVFVAENYVYKPIAEHLRSVIEAGELGEVRFVSVNATKRQPPTAWRANPALSGGGALFEAGVHWISFMSRIGLVVETVQGYSVGRTQGPDQSSLVVFRYAGGAVGTLAHSWELAAPLRGLRLSKVQGTRGAVTFESNGLAAYTTGGRRSIQLPALSDPLGYRAMLGDFVGALRSGRDPRFTLDMAQSDLRRLEEASTSMSLGVEQCVLA